MVKAWMIILIICTPIKETPTSSYCYEKMMPGSIFKTENDCLYAIKEEATRGNKAFCVETESKWL